MVEAHATVAGERGSGDRLDELDRGRAAFAVDRVHVRIDDAVGAEKRNPGIDGWSPLDAQCGSELLHRRVQIGDDEANVKERIVDYRRCHFYLL